MGIRELRSTFGWALGALALGGCSSLFCGGDRPRVDTQEEAGSTHVTVLAVKSFDELKQDLQPQFTMATGQDALSQILPDTGMQYLASGRTRYFGADIALPTSTTTVSSQTTQQGTATPVTTKTTTKNQAPGDLTDGPDLEPPASASILPTSKVSLPTGALEEDPMLKYLTATALYQEVKLLNTYVASAAIPAGYDAYVVRMQVAVVPRVRSLPYDVALTLSFFETRENKGRLANTDSERSFALADRAAPVPGVTRSTKPEPIQVLPLLVTDNLEAATVSRNLSQTDQTALALSAILQGVALGASWSSINEQIRDSLTKDMNSLFLVARNSSNSVRVRLGAVHAGVERYAMLARTHNVTLLVLVDHDLDASGIECLAKSAFVDVKTGEPLPEGNINEAKAIVRRAVAGLPLKPSWKQDVPGIVAAVQDDDRSLFNERLLGLVEAGKMNELKAVDDYRLWADVVEVVSGRRYQTIHVELPPRTEPGILKQQSALLIDDGKSSMVELFAGNNLSRLQPTLNASVRFTDAGGQDHWLGASAIAAIAGGRGLRLSFPSLVGAGIAPVSGPAPALRLVVWEDGPLAPIVDGSLILQRQQPAAGPLVQPLFDVTRIPIDANGKYELSLVLRRNSATAPSTFAFRVVDAKLDTTNPNFPGGRLRADADRWVVSLNADLIVELKLPLTGMEGAKSVSFSCFEDGKPTTTTTLDIARPK